MRARYADGPVIDGARRPPAGRELPDSRAAGADASAGQDLKARVTVRGRPARDGAHLSDGSSLLDGRLRGGRRAASATHFNDRRHPRSAPAIDQISADRTYEAKGAEKHSEPPPVVRVPARSGATRRRGGRGLRQNDSRHADAAALIAGRTRESGGRGPMAFIARPGREGFDAGMRRR